MPDTTDPTGAINSLRAALDEEYPGEFVDPAALRTVLDELDRLTAIVRRARIARGALWVDDADRYLVNYILDNTVPDRVPSPTRSED